MDSHISVFHMWNDKLYRHRREQFTKQIDKVWRYINALKGNLTSSMLRDKSSKQSRRRSLRHGMLYLMNGDVPQTGTVSVATSFWQISATGVWLVQSNEKKKKKTQNVTVGFPVKADLNKNNIPKHPQTKQRHVWLYKSPLSVSFLNKITDKCSSGALYSPENIQFA